MTKDNTFKRDLEAGKVYEKKALEVIQKKYPLAHEIEGYCKEWDIFIPEIGEGVEVKSDQKSKHTGNIVIEIEFNGKPSALSTTKAKFWVIYDGDNWIWFLVEDIKRCIKENNLSYATFTAKGDTKSKKAYLIKKETLYQYQVLPEFYKAFKWAEENRIRVYPVKRGSKFILALEENGYVKTSGKEYEKKEIDLKQKEYYIYLYKNFKDV